MPHCHRPALPLELSGHIHQAAEIAGQQQVGLGLDDVGAFLFHHGVRDIGIFHGERAAEAATDLAIGHLDKFQAFDGCEQCPRLVLDVEFAQPRATVVISGRGIEVGIDRGHPPHIDQERHQFVHLGGERCCTWFPSLVVGKQRGIMLFQHAGARTRWRHDIVEAPERRDRLPGQGLGCRPVAGVVGGLAAAGLCRRHLHLAPGGLEQLDGGNADRGPHQIDKTRHEQAHARGAGCCGGRRSRRLSRRLGRGRWHGSLLDREGLGVSQPRVG